MVEINFITGNGGKVLTLQKAFVDRGRNDIEVKQQKLEIIEPQADTVKEVSKNKALQAYKILHEPLLVEDGGFCIDALNGFPGVYTRYVLDTIGAEGLLKLMSNNPNRNCGFVSCITYIDGNGKIMQFDSSDKSEGELATELVRVDCKEAWSDIWYIYKIKSIGKTLAEYSIEKQNHDFNKNKTPRDSKQKNSYNIDAFADWYVANH